MITGLGARQALFTLLEAKTAPGQPLEGWDVTERVPGEFGQRCIYGGGRRFVHTDMVAEGPGVMVAVVTTQTVYIRTMNSGPDADVDTEADAEDAAQIIAKILKDNPKLGGGLTWQGIASGFGDYESTGDDQVTNVVLNILLGRAISYD
jgi:hypothetical protein